MSKKYRIKTEKVGMLLSKQYPIFYASLDGSSNSHCIVFKCPSKAKNIKSYIRENGTLIPKVQAQILLQMLLTGRRDTVVLQLHSSKLQGNLKLRKFPTTPKRSQSCCKAQKNFSGTAFFNI